MKATVITSTQKIAAIEVRTLHYRLSGDPRVAEWLGDAPVWPLRNEQELALLRRLAESYDMRCEEVGQLPVSQRGDVSGEVLVFEPALYDEATRYAHITQRRLRICSESSAVASALDCEVVFAFSDTVNSVLLECMLLQSSVTSSMPGLLCVPRDSSGTVCLAKAFFATSNPRSRYLATEIHPALDDEVVLVDGVRHFFGGDANATLLGEHLRSHRGLIAFNGHSDGVDATLSDRAYLCDIRRNRGSSSQSLPACHRSGHCRRLNQPLDRAVKDGRILDVADVRARVVVWNTCWGVAPPPHTEQNFSLGLQLGMSEEIGALVTTCGGSVLQNVATGPTLIHGLANGLPVGTAVHRHNDSLAAKQIGHQMILIGDPLCRAAGRSNGGRRSLSDELVVNHDDIAMDSRLVWIEQILASMDLPGLDEGVVAAQFAPLEKILSGRHSNRDEPRTKHLRTLQNWVLGKLELKSPFLGWYQEAVLAPEGGSNDIAQCPVCNSKTLVNTLVGYVRDPRLAPRMLVRCPRCGLAADKPLSSRVRVRVDAAQNLVLRGIEDRSKAVATLVVETRTEQLHIARWPEMDGVIVESFRSSILRTPDGVDWFVIVLDELDLCVFHGYVDDLSGVAQTAE